MRTMLSAGLLSVMLLSGCVVRTPGPRHHGPPPGAGAGPSNRAEEGAQAEEQTQASERMKADERRREEERAHQGEAPPPPDRTPPPPREPAAPELSVELEPRSARPGQNVTLTIRPFRPNVMVFFNGRPLPRRTEGERFIVTVPGNAHSGHFEVQWDGRRFRSPRLDVMR